MSEWDELRKVADRKRREKEEKDRKEREQRAEQRRQEELHLSQQRREERKRREAVARVKRESKKWDRIVKRYLIEVAEATVKDGRMECGYRFRKNVEDWDPAVTWKVRTLRRVATDHLSIGVSFWEWYDNLEESFYSVELEENSEGSWRFYVSNAGIVPTTEEDLKRALVEAYQHGPRYDFHRKYHDESPEARKAREEWSEHDSGH